MRKRGVKAGCEEGHEGRAEGVGRHMPVGVGADDGGVVEARHVRGEVDGEELGEVGELLCE